MPFYIEMSTKTILDDMALYDFNLTWGWQYKM